MIYDTKIISRKTGWIIILSVCAFTPVYLYYVKQQRKESVTNYSTQPRVGDIYKIQQDTPEDGVSVFYLKVINIDNQDVHFYRSRMIGTIPNDAILKQFDATRQMVYTKTELAEISAGKWMTASKDKTQLIEIERKQ